MERKMLDLKLQDKITCSEIRRRTKIIDIIEYTLKQVEMGRAYSKNEGQQVDQTLHRVEEFKRTTKQTMARQHVKERREAPG